MKKSFLSCVVALVIAQSVTAIADDSVNINLQSSSVSVQNTDTVFIRNIDVQFQGNNYTCDVPFKWNATSYVFQIDTGATCVAVTDAKKVRVHVSDSITGLPVANAVVEIGTKQGTSDSDGNVYFTTLTQGDYSMFISASGYQSESVSFNLSTSNKYLNLALSK